MLSIHFAWGVSETRRPSIVTSCRGRLQTRTKALSLCGEGAKGGHNAVRDMIGKSTGRDQQIGRSLESTGSHRAENDPFRVAVLQSDLANGIRSAQQSGHSTNKQVAPGGLIRDQSTMIRSRCSSQVCLVLHAGVPVPKRPSGVTDRDAAVRTTQPHPSTPLSLGAGSISFSGNVLRGPSELAGEKFHGTLELLAVLQYGVQ